MHANRQPKDFQAVTITTKVIGCYREHKFPEGDKRRACHWGLDAIQPERCVLCTFYHEVPGKVSNKLLTGRDIISLSVFLKTLKETPDALADERRPTLWERAKNFFRNP
jgi:hypothetical protein